MQEHVHTGFVNVVFAGLSALLIFNLLRYAAIELDSHQKGQWLSKVIGASLNFSNAGVNG